MASPASGETGNPVAVSTITMVGTLVTFKIVIKTEEEGKDENPVP